jgi:hypothetical protein
MTNAAAGPGIPPDPNAAPAPGQPWSRVTPGGDLQDWNGSQWVPHKFLAQAPVGGDPEPAVHWKVAGDEARERAAVEALAELEAQDEAKGQDGDEGQDRAEE